MKSNKNPSTQDLPQMDGINLNLTNVNRTSIDPNILNGNS
jgi:hypothetical protein